MEHLESDYRLDVFALQHITSIAEQFEHMYVFFFRSKYMRYLFEFSERISLRYPNVSFVSVDGVNSKTAFF